MVVITSVASLVLAVLAAGLEKVPMWWALISAAVAFLATIIWAILNESLSITIFELKVESGDSCTTTDA